MERLFTYAGVSRREGMIVFRATSRETYAQTLSNEGDEDIKIIPLPRIMTKPEARQYIRGLRGFKTPEIQEALTTVISSPDEREMELQPIRVKRPVGRPRKYPLVEQQLTPVKVRRNQRVAA